MAIYINWTTFTIHVPKADMTLVQSYPFEIRQLDVDEFRLALKNLEDSAAGMVYPNTHNHNAPITVGGVTLARVVEVLSPYTITFEDGQYAVNLYGGNNNISDKTNLNQVSVRSANSAGLISVGGTSLTEAQVQSAVWNAPASDYMGGGTTGLLLNSMSADLVQLRLDAITILDLVELILKYDTNRTKIDKIAKTLTVYDNDGSTPLRVFQLKDSNGVASVTEVAERVPV